MLSLEAGNHVDRIRRIVQYGMDNPEVSAAVTLSWTRCINDYGLDPESKRLPPVLTQTELLERRERSRILLAEARQEMNILYQQLADPELAVVLVHTDGSVLHMVAAASLEHNLSMLGLRPGAVWSEEQAGTNGMGTCLVVAEPIAIQQNDHFFSSHIRLTCSAVPIKDQHGDVIAVLDVTSRSTLLQQHSLVLIGMTARMIENRLLDATCQKAHAIHFHSRPESIYTVHEGKLMVDGDGTIVAANHSALFQLGFASMAELRASRFDDIFQSSLETILQRSLQSSFHPVPIYRAGASSRFFAIAQHPPMAMGAAGPELHGTTPRGIVIPAAAAPLRGKATADLAAASELELGDAGLREQFALASRVIARRVPVLLYGETGSGKEVFARALHDQGARRNGPFVAVNCASLPESLIESELFGYRAGAFTGAQRQGRKGKILQADNGTLFLDEIGDMPLALQARLLRVLDERKVTPLGSETCISVELQLISASHRNMAELVRCGLFREDLYYRLNGVEVRLPALRDRADKRELIHSLLQEEAGGPLRLSPQAEAMLMSYPWPGNLRQLRHILRTMVVLCDGDTLGLQHIPASLSEAAVNAPEPPAAVPAMIAPPAPAAPESLPADAASMTMMDALNPLQVTERATLIQLLDTYRWNISNVAKALGISRNTLYRKLHRLCIPLSSQSEQDGDAAGRQGP